MKNREKMFAIYNHGKGLVPIIHKELKDVSENITILKKKLVKDKIKQFLQIKLLPASKHIKSS